jgi:anti-sigma factor RsiW
MQPKKYTTEEIYDYLLGALPEAETEVFDELSFADDDFAAELAAYEKDLVDAYVNGELTGDRLDRFESFYPATPRRRGKIEFAAAFREFAGRESENTAVVSSAEQTPGRSFGDFLNGLLTAPKLSMQWGFALAALVFLLFGGLLYFENARLNTELSRAQTENEENLKKRETELAGREKDLRERISAETQKNAAAEKELAEIRKERERLAAELKKQPPRETVRPRPAEKEQLAGTKKQPVRTGPPVSVASFVLTPSLRSGGDLPTASIPAGTTSVAMRLELESDDFESYRVVLTDQTGAALWQSGAVRAQKSGADASLDIRFPVSLLKAQIYTLEVSGAAADGTSEKISSYSFRVVR